MNILHAVGWGLLSAIIINVLSLLILIYFDEDCTESVGAIILLFSLATAFSVFLLTL